MKKTLTISDQSVEVNSSAGWFYDYREQFGHDIMPDLLPILEGVLGTLAEITDGDEIQLSDEIVGKIIDALAGAEITTIFNIVWAMAHNADDDIEPPRKWANHFERFEMDQVVPELVTLLLESSVSSKNATSLLEKVKSLKTSTLQQ